MQNTINLQFKKLTPQLTNEFLHYFENDAFPENDPRSGCFCLESHLKEESQYVDIEERRQKAIELIQKEIMTGYLIYDKDRIVAWCNAGDKMNFSPVCENHEFLTTNCEKGKIKILYCMDIAPDYQGKGIASLIMEKVISDAEEEGYTYVEGYPFLDREYIWQYRGPARLYEKYGFEVYAEKSWFYIMRKEIK